MRSIRVLFDEQIFLLQVHGGISRYYTELIKAFEANPKLGIKPVLASPYARNRYILTEPSSFRLKQVKTPLGALIRLVIEMILNRAPKLPIDDPDLVHLTFYLPGFFGRFRNSPKVVTLHDMIPEKTRRRFGFWNPHFSKKSHVAKANLLLSVSKSSTLEMSTVYGYKRQAVTTYLGVGSEFRPDLPDLAWLPRRYFMFVGNRNSYKDCDLAYRAFARISPHFPGLVLLLVGGGPLTHSEKKLINQQKISEAVIQKTVIPTELPNVYSNSLGLIYPSRHEGFGLPLVEAMASGIPILAAQTPINMEIAEDCASFFPVGDEKVLSDLMLKLATSPGQFKDKVESGMVRAKNFTWEKCAELTAAAYRSLLVARKEKK